MATLRFPIRLGRRSSPLLRLFGVGGQEDAWVELRDDDLEARFGWSHAVTPVSNIAGWRIEGPWLWVTAIGVRMSVRHGDITFAGSHRGGVRLDFAERVRVGPFRVPALYVTVDDLEGSPRPSPSGGSRASTCGHWSCPDPIRRWPGPWPQPTIVHAMHVSMEVRSLIRAHPERADARRPTCRHAG